MGSINVKISRIVRNNNFSFNYEFRFLIFYLLYSSLDKGDIVIEQGILCDKFYQVSEGRCIAKVQDPVTKECQIIDVIGPGEVFGEICMLLGIASNVTVEALGPASVVCTKRTDLEELIQTIPIFTVSLYKFLAKTILARLQKLELVDENELAEFKKVTAPLVDTRKLLLPCQPMPKSPAILRRKQREAPKNTEEEPSLPLSIPPVLRVPALTKQRSVSFGYGASPVDTSGGNLSAKGRDRAPSTLSAISNRDTA